MASVMAAGARAGAITAAVSAGASWDPFWGDPFFDRDIDINTVEKYEATAEIVMGKGPKPAGNVRAFDARAVMANIGPTVVLPK